MLICLDLFCFLRMKGTKELLGFVNSAAAAVEVGFPVQFGYESECVHGPGDPHMMRVAAQHRHDLSPRLPLCCPAV